ncbi:efflux RND transporter periplasmic adaptor subunit [Spirosoma montaniterrae]|uniref:Efflux transporter periplasmic adaptor subunit n=1 Tax=Spirosoma montaniterrae TaxID=1178516 RepID=A0A1P9WUZ0_9BACT|nr:efflux RND transporter periplasmic adaptor subunit [Spirosoma montaniterrae]AQG79212.1 efflux transporter periplasmic adaptor subunit [Spirosoma montaniterrae]
MRSHRSLQVFIACALLAGCTSRSETPKKTDKPAVPVLELTRQNATLDRDYAGQLEAVQNVEVRARVAGYLDKMLVDEGQAVHKGQLLFQLNQAEYQVKIAEAQASLESAVAQQQSAAVEMDRVKLLVDKNVISPTELKLSRAKMATARAAIDQAKAALANARLLVSLTSIRAPFDGVINRLPFKRGSLIEEGTLLTTISDLSQMYAYFNVSEREYLASIRKRRDPNKLVVREVDLLLADDSAYPHKGKIETTETVFEGNTGTIAFRATFPNPDRLLRHGATGKIRLTTEVDDAVLVPQKAVFEVQDKNFVYVVDGGNKVRTRSFVPSSRVDQFYVVKSGLKPGDRVVYEGIQQLRDGMAITPRSLPADSLKILFASAQ